MRNLRKYLSVLLVVAMLATSMVPAFAAPSFTYADEATKLNELGLYQGISDTTFDPDLGTALNRETAVVMLLRIFGLEDEAAAMTAAEVAAALKPYTDAKDVSAWAVNHMAYAIANGLVQGMSETTLAPKVAVSGKMYATLILRQLGYTVAGNDYNTAAAMLADKGGLTAAEAVKFNDKNLIKDDLVGISFGSLAAVDADGKTVIANLVAGGLDAELAAEFGGYVAPTATPTPTPAAAAVSKVSTDNLKSFKVEFNKAVDSTTFTFTANGAIATDNVRLYAGSTIQNIAAVAFASDYKSATIYTTAALAQDTTYTFTTSAVKAGTETIAGSTSFVVKDVTSPTVSSVSFTGPQTMVITFSEPINAVVPASKVWSSITIDGNAVGGYLVNTSNMYKYTMTLSSALAVGDHAVAITNADAALSADYAGFKFASYSATVPLVADTAAPSVTSVNVVNKSKIEVNFNETVNTTGSTFSFTNTTGAWAIDVANTSGSKVTFINTTGSLNANALSSVTFSYTAVKDLYGNSTGSTALTYVFAAPLDVTKPVPTVALNADNTFTVEFNEDVDATAGANGATNTANYVLYDSTGASKGVASSAVAYSVGNTKKFTVAFAGVLGAANPGTYTLKINNVADQSILGNTMVESVTTVVVNDTSAPTATAAYYTTGTAKVAFTEAMDATTLADKNNYLVAINGGANRYLSAITGATVTVAADNKSVLVYIPTTDTVGTFDGTNDTITLLAIKDTAAKYLSNLNVALTIGAPTAFGTATATLVSLNQVKVSLGVGTAVYFDPTTASTANYWYIDAPSTAGDANTLTNYVVGAAVSTDGTYVTLTLDSNISANATKTVTSGTYNLVVYTVPAVGSSSVKSTFGSVLSIAYAAGVQVADGVAPTATVATGAATGEIAVTFNEAVTAGSITLYNNTTGAVVTVGNGSVTGNTGNYAQVTAGTSYKITGLTSGYSYTVTLSGLTDGTNTAASAQYTVTAK